MFKKFLLCALIVLISCLTSCSFDLSRDAAALQIKDRYPSDITHSLDYESTTYGAIWIGWSRKRVMEKIAEVESQLDSLQRHGYLEWEKRYKAKSRGRYSINLKSDIGNGFYNYVIHPTDKMKPSIKEQNGSKYTIIVGEIVFEGVTGIISAGEDVRVVQYAYTYKYNELGRQLLSTDDMNERSESQATFRKYDDGWRMQ